MRKTSIFLYLDDERRGCLRNAKASVLGEHGVVGNSAAPAKSVPKRGGRKSTAESLTTPGERDARPARPCAQREKCREPAGELVDRLRREALGGGWGSAQPRCELRVQRA